jgi:transcriptional regulator with XRE-family HTH domain
VKYLLINLSLDNFVDMKGEELKFFRKKHNLTQKELGDKIGVSDTKISQWENNVHKISKAYLLHIERLFDEFNNK